MQFHDDIYKAFEPLENHVKKNYPATQFNDTMSKYMYMGHEDHLYYYKHKDTRTYLNIQKGDDK
jgi:hypothetical protein